ncbi:hypothetical protein [Paenibacillus senegalensis]|uniref:hypothetical protein n=1 Tax=Paenibacillus senegalensis TaxID=1465766 RepID=UPI0011DCFECC|nr:hypothetical protein [Paenibacillus senegalensis]
MIQKGPKPYSQDEWKRERYEITNLIDDLIGGQNYDEQLFIVNKLTEKICNFILISRKQWQGSGKWTPRLIKKLDGNLYKIDEITYKGYIPRLQFIYACLI